MKEFYANKPLPRKLQDDIKDNEIDLKSSRTRWRRRRRNSSEINAKYDEDKRRYLELTGGERRQEIASLAAKADFRARGS